MIFYDDDFAEDTDAYLERNGQFDEQGYRLEQNTESNGRFHTDWLNMIYPRLRIAKDFLTENGIIVISIDTNEVDEMLKLTKEMLGEQNLRNIIAVRRGIKLNAEDGGHRKFIMVQIPEVCPPDSEAAKAGYSNICEIGKERIRRAGRKIQQEAGLTAQDLDIGFRVLRLDSSNMQAVYYTPRAITQSLLDLTTDNIKPDRTPEDLLFQVMLDLGVELSSKIEEIDIAGKRVFRVAEGFMLACFDPGVTSETVVEIAKKQPYYAVFRDSSMASDSVAANFEQIFQTYSPDTVRKVL